MDTACTSTPTTTSSCPSMEPRPFSHGYGPLSIRDSPPAGSFNGATTFQPWIRDGDAPVYAAATDLQWSHDLSAMDTARYPFVIRLRLDPSMEPRPFSHGYATGMRRSTPQRPTFNGATTFQPWIPDGAWIELAASQWAFNGATTFQPWIRATIGSDGLASMYLQWSHDLSAMDTRHRERADGAAHTPSMEPRPFSHGYKTSDSWLLPTITSFNGATTFQPWIRCTGSQAGSLP